MRAPRRHPLSLVAAGALALAATPTAAALAHGGDDGRGHGRHGDHGPKSTTPAPTLPETLALPNGWAPEGIAAGKRGTLYVGSIPTGAVRQLDPRTGTGKTLVPARDGRAAIGLKVAGKQLVVAGGTTGRAFIYDAQTGADVADVPLTTGNSFINDVAITKCGAVFTDSRQPQLYRVTLASGHGDRGRHGGKNQKGRKGTRLGGGGHGHGGGWGHVKGCTVKPGTPTPTTPEPTTPEPTATSTSVRKTKQRTNGTATPTVATIPITGAFQYDDDPATNEANGIVALPWKNQLLVVQSRTGKLFRVDGSTGVSVEVPITGGPLTNGDGLLLIGRALFVVQNRLNQIAVVKLGRDYASGEVTQTITSPLFRVPTTLAASRFGIYTVNARFGTPATPTTDYDVVRVPLGGK